MKIVVAPDAFKGTLTAKQAAAAIAAGIKHTLPGAHIVEMPMADGGEGTLDVLQQPLAGRRRWARVTGCDASPLRASFATFIDAQGRETALIEVARIVGLYLPTTASVSVLHRTSLGVGELIRHCLDRGLRRFVIAVGGSGSNDGGAGLLTALGVRLLDAAGSEIPATLVGLQRLVAIDTARLDGRLKDSAITVLSDVDNPLCGSRGATAVYGPQKGIADNDIAACDHALARLAARCAEAFGFDPSAKPGAGAAGGTGFALQLLGARSCSGAKMVADMIGLGGALAAADWLITGEGRSDAQTLAGKAPSVAARMAHELGVPACLLSGSIARDDFINLCRYFDIVAEVKPEALSTITVRHQAGVLLRRAAAELARHL